MLSNTQKGVSLVLVAGISWGVISIFIRSLTACGFSSWEISSVRAICAGLTLAVTIPCLNHQAFKVKPKDLWCLAGCGVASITLFNILYFATMQQTTVNVAVVLLYTSPVFVTLMSCFFFKETFTSRKLLALVLVLLGCCLVAGIFNSHARLSPMILLTGIGSGFSYALFSIFGRCAQNRGYSSEVITLWSFLFAGVVSLFLLDYGQAATAISSHPQILLSMAGLVVVSTILPYWTYTAGLRLIQPSSAAIIVSIEPLMGTLVGTLVFGEPLSVSAIIGMVMILGSCVLCL